MNPQNSRRPSKFLWNKRLVCDFPATGHWAGHTSPGEFTNMLLLPPQAVMGTVVLPRRCGVQHLPDLLKRSPLFGGKLH